MHTRALVAITFTEGGDNATEGGGAVEEGCNGGRRMLHSTRPRLHVSARPLLDVLRPRAKSHLGRIYIDDKMYAR